MERLRPTSQSRLTGIEGLRALAAAGVVVSHCGSIVSRSGTQAQGLLGAVTAPFAAGVVLFFVLSGFLLYRPFAVAVVRGEARPSFRRYYRNRVLRILPAYWVILFVTVFLFQVAVFDFDSRQYLTGGFQSARNFFSELLLVQNYAPSTIGTGITPAWSLAIEAVFYLVLPLLALCAFVVRPRLERRGLGHWAILAPVVIMVSIGLIGKVLLELTFSGSRTALTGNWHAVVQFSFLGYADVFAWGMFVAVLMALYEEGKIGLPSKRVRLWAEAAVLVLFVGASLATPAEGDAWLGLVGPLPFALLLAFVVLSQGRGGSRALGLRLLETRPVVACGVVSYSVFLWNAPLLFFMRDHGAIWYGPAGFVLTLAVLVVLCGVLSALSYRYVELPALRLKSGGFLGATISIAPRIPALKPFRRPSA